MCEMSSQGRDPDRLVLDVDDVATVLSTWTGIPVGRMTEDEMSKILKLSQLLSAVSQKVYR